MITTILVWWDNGKGTAAWQSTADHHSDLVTGENADAVSAQDVPKSDGAIRRPRGHIVGVGVEAGAGDIS